MSEIKKPKLIVHIGAGKTGSSSIQFTLLENQADMNAHGFKYLGLMLENVGEKQKFEWMSAGASKKLLAMATEDASDQVYAVLRREMDTLQDQKIHTAVWSNELMFTRESWFVPALKRIQADGNDVKIICYVRRHDKWARSAYAQWGIKHKAYPGPVRSFAEWSKGRSFHFYPAVKPWFDAFADNTSLFNFDAAGEVVSHFCNAIGYSPLKIVQENITPSKELMAVWAVFNSRFNDEVLPVRFTSAVRGTGLMEKSALSLPKLRKLYPSEEDMVHIRDVNGPDREALDGLLVAQGQVPLDNAAFSEEQTELDQWKMNQILLRLIFELQEKVHELEKVKNG